MYQANWLSHNWLKKRTVNIHVADRLPLLSEVVLDLGYGTRPFERGDYYRHTRPGLEYLLRESGFEEVTIKPVTGFWSMRIFNLNYQLFTHIRGSRAVRVVQCMLLQPFLWLDQKLAWHFDRYWREDGEIVGYFVSVLKP